jgi:hypothetical protein
MKELDFDWIIVGGGAAGIAIAEMLSRLGLRIAILEKNPKLASETTRVFHEWLHTGSLYTLVPDQLKTTRYLLGAIDDLFEYYSGYSQMNLMGTDSGLEISSQGWFNSQPIHYLYRSRPYNLIWSLAIARSRWLINEIDQHDWLRKRAGSIYDGFRFNPIKIVNNYPKVNTNFINVKSPDVTINSRILLTDLLNSFEKSNNCIVVNCEVFNITDHDRYVVVKSSAGNFIARHVVICCADGISRFINSNLKISYAPMFAVGGISNESPSFVELDYYAKSCINLLNKGSGYGLAGGISVSNEDEIRPYYEYCVALHKKRNPNIKVLGMYVGKKKELVNLGQNRNYLYHINNISQNVWGVVLGKFTLMFSLAPEFIRRVYYRNPPRQQQHPCYEHYGTKHQLLSNPYWLDIINESESK